MMRSYWLLLLVSILLTTAPYVDGDRPSSQCVQVGQSISGEPDQNPTYTIGAENFTTRNIIQLGNFASTFPRGRFRGKNLLDRTCKEGGYGDTSFLRFCPDNVEIRTNLVRQNGIVLRGWLHVEIELTDKTDSMEYIYVQIRDEYFSAIGEFVTDEAEQCKSSRKGLVQPTPYQVYPCSAIGSREAKASSALFVAKRSQYVNSFIKDPSNEIQYITKEDLTLGIYFTWRLSEFWCSRHERFRVEANILTQKSTLKTGLDGKDVRRMNLFRKAADYWLHPAWFGAADIKVGENPLDCNLSAIDYNTGEVSKEAVESWIQPNATLLTFANDITNPALEIKAKTGSYLANCVRVPYDDGNPENLKSRGRLSTIPRFGGRCFNHTSNKPSMNYTQGCSNDPSSPEHRGLNFTTYTEYYEKKTKGRLNQCKRNCVHPDPHNQTHLEDIQSYPKKIRPVPKIRVSLFTLRKARAHSRNATFWQTRKFHGNLCVFVTMFLIPFSNFIARYYKETFLENYHAIPVYLWIHGSVGYVSLTLFRSSYTAMRENIANWGTSDFDAAKFHRYFGYMFGSIFTVMSFLGGIRTVSPTLRPFVMMAHAVTGFALQFMAFALVIFSKDIPASPSADCNEKTGLPEGSSETAIYASVWMATDLLFHIMMTTSQKLLDRKERVKRPGGMGFIFVPMLQPHHHKNYVGNTFRKVVLFAYTTLSLTFTFLTIGRMFVNDDYDKCSLGELSCNVTENPFGCSPLSKKYFKLVLMDRFNVTSISELEIEN